MRTTRHIVTAVTIGTLLFTTFFPANAQTGIPVPSMSQCGTLVQNFMNTYGIRGGEFALARNGKLVYSRGFGNVNQTGTEPVMPYHMFRIASVSKPVTSIGMMRLVENGQLNLDAPVFGPSGILANDPYFASATITDTRIFNITTRQLLEHSAGWNRDLPMTPSPLPPYPWGYASSDPIGFPLHVTMTLGESNPVSRRALIKFLLQRGLDFTPGTSYAYSNIGYIVLAEIVEEITGIPYEQYMKTQLFEPVGSYDMHVAGNLLADKREREAEYLSTNTSLSIFGTGQSVPMHYGGINVTAMDAHGGWIASASDLVRLLTAVDGYPTRPDVLSQASLTNMTSPSSTNTGYAKGWQVHTTGFSGNWWHSGSLPGTSSFLVRTNTQFAWAFVFNETAAGNYFSALDGLGWNCLAATSTYPTHDLFDVPETPASDLAPILRSQNSLTIDWQPGNGSGRVIVMRAGAVPNRYPIDGTNYAAPNGGPYTDIGGGNFVVFSGTESTVQIDGLQANTNYFFRVYEFNNSANTGNNALYQLGRFHEASVSTLAPGANGSISGRVIGSNGRGAANAVVTVRDQANSIVAFGRTSSFGFYRIENVLLGNNYAVTASAKRENFSTVNVAMNGDLSGVDITAVSSMSK